MSYIHIKNNFINILIWESNKLLFSSQAILKRSCNLLLNNWCQWICHHALTIYNKLIIITNAFILPILMNRHFSECLPFSFSIELIAIVPCFQKSSSWDFFQWTNLCIENLFMHIKCGKLWVRISDKNLYRLHLF